MTLSQRDLFLMLVAVLATPGSAWAQQTGKVWRIGFLGVANAVAFERSIEAIRIGLREHGYVEGRNVTIEFWRAEGRYDRLPALAAELVRLNLDVIITHGAPGTLALKQATSTIPIVMAAIGNPVENGAVASLARPGGNITGSAISALRALERTAQALSIKVQPLEVRRLDELDSAITTAKTQIDALVVPDEQLFSVGGTPRRIADLAIRNRMPSIGSTGYAESGGLIDYGVNFPDLWRRSMIFVDKILKGAKPADLPVEQSSKFELGINLKTAKALGLTIPPLVLGRADRVIE